MSGKTSPAPVTIAVRPFYGDDPPVESPSKRSRLTDSNSSTTRPAFRSLKDYNSPRIDKKLLEPLTIKSQELTNTIERPLQQQDVVDIDNIPSNDEETNNKSSLDRDSPLPLKNLGNTCYENSIIQCLFSLSMFMDNFERSMQKMRQFVHASQVKPQTKSDLLINDKSDEQPKINADTQADQSPTITEDDVRFRIADAFDNLYKCYTQRRIQIESNSSTSNGHHSNNQKGGSVSAVDVSTDHLNKAKEDFNLDPAIHQSNKAIPLCKLSTSLNDPSMPQSSPTEARNERPKPLTLDDINNAFLRSNAALLGPSFSNVDEFNDPDLDENYVLQDASSSAPASNMTPVALVSSATASNEQSEIEIRLEELKSAVGERSSQFNSAHQQDASEFFYHVIDSIQEFYQALHRTKDEDNPVTKAFELELDYLIRCPKCHHKILTEPEKIRTLPLALPHVNNDIQPTTNHEGYNIEANGVPTPPTSDLGSDSPGSNASEEQRNCLDDKGNQALNDDIQNETENNEPSSGIVKSKSAEKSELNIFQNNQSQKPRTLCEALKNYFKDDLLEYRCSQQGCDSKRRTKKCLIRKLPQVLFITLARYSYTGKKNLDEIEAPFELSVPFQENKSPSHSPSAHRDTDDDDDRNKYQLMAVVCHLGSSLNAGHYTSYVYNQNNSSWYSCDDDSITKVQEADVRNDSTRSGYCFFYARESSINQQTQQHLEKQEAQMNKESSQNRIANNCVTDSSVIFTPESSPITSPSPPMITHEDGATSMNEDHRCCTNGVDTDDWS